MNHPSATLRPLAAIPVTGTRRLETRIGESTAYFGDLVCWALVRVGILAVAVIQRIRSRPGAIAG
ncbi:MAG: hypothetical protein SFX72_14615 [Isosphaeraceae bacterium]|nr:hypothetical protein [Isosphaeraceae bacterium]